MSAYPNLSEPWSPSEIPVRNRLMFSAMSTVAPVDGGVSDRLVNIFANRAQGGAGLLVTEALIFNRGLSAPTRIRAWDETKLDGLKRWAAAVEAHDSRLVGQFNNPGRGRHHPGRSEGAISASVRPDDLSWTVPRALTRAEISSLVAEAADTAHRLQRAGFSGVELSCGHGHLFHQFLSPQANRREDEYGGGPQGRTRLVRELCAAIRAACGERFILGLKLVGRDRVPGGVDEAEAERLLPLLVADNRVSYVALVQGAHHRSLEAHMPDRSYPLLPARDMLRRLRPFAHGTPMVGIARITTPAEAEGLLADGDCEAVMLGRGLIADAGWFAKASAGREADIRLCINCNSCWGEITALRPINCDVNPLLGAPDEVTWTAPKAAAPRRIAVVGAGIAGLEAAWTAAREGHAVTLFGASPEAGGAMRTNAEIPGCAQLGRIAAFQLQQAEAAGVIFRLGKRAGLDDLTNFDAVVLASGAEMLWPDGIAHGCGAVDVRTAIRALLASPGPRGGTAVLVDRDHTAGTYDAMELLAERFERAVLLTPREAIASDVALVVRQRIQARIYGRRIPVKTFVELAGFEAGRLDIRHVHTGDIETIDGVTLLAYSTPRTPRDELADELQARGVRVILAGDCRTPRTTMAAVREGHDAALAIGNT
jgi:dimethylglycine catabolism A